MTHRPVATLMLYNKNKEVLLQHREENISILPGYWGLFGGGIEEGETPEEAMRRELFEEIEYTPRNPQFFMEEESVPGDNLHVTGHVFVEEYDELQPIVQHEGQGYGWFTIEEALKLKITPLRRASLIKMKGYLEKLP